MINIFVETPSEGERKKGQIDPEASYEEIKSSIVHAFNLGSPKDYRLFHEPPASRKPTEDRIQEGDIFVLMKKVKPPAFIPSDNNDRSK